MLLPAATLLLQRGVYVLVKAGRDLVLPYTPARWQQVLEQGGYPSPFESFLQRVLNALASTADWPAGSVFPGGWFRSLQDQGLLAENGATLGSGLPPITPEALAAYSMPPLRVDGGGGWWVGDKALDARVRGFLLRKLEWDAEVARYRVRYPLEHHDETRYLQHASPPLRVQALHFDPDGVRMALNDGSEALLQPETLRLDAQERLFCAVRPEGLPAWFSDGCRFTLLDRMEPDVAYGGWRLTLPGQSSPVTLALQAPWPGADTLPVKNPLPGADPLPR